jgi:hypothetical protein
MRYFTISKKGRKGYNFIEMGYTYELNVDMFGKIEEFLIYADNRQAAIKAGETIVSTITFESTTKSVQSEVNKQNGLQQLKVAYRMLKTHEDAEKVMNYIQRLKAHFNIIDETKVEEIQVAQTVEVINEVNNENEQETQEKPVQSVQTEQSYIAYNRSFLSYNEAYNYCEQSDLDLAYIVTEEPSEASQHSLQLDLQLFASESNQPEISVNSEGYTFLYYNTNYDLDMSHNEWQRDVNKHMGAYNKLKNGNTISETIIGELIDSDYSFWIKVINETPYKKDNQILISLTFSYVNKPISQYINKEWYQSIISNQNKQTDRAYYKIGS